jgi:hypothetical protein
MLGLSKRQILAQSRINSSAIEMAAMKELPASPLNEAPPPITPKSDSRQIVVRRFSQKKVAFVKKNKPNRRTQPQTDGQSTSQPQTPLPAPPDQPSPSTAVNELISEYEHLSSPTFPEPPHTNSTRTSYSSSAHATEATITIQPSPSLRAMQSIALDTSPAPTNTTWRPARPLSRPRSTSPAVVRPGSPTLCAPAHARPRPCASSSRTCRLKMKMMRTRCMGRRRKIWMI